MRPLAPLFPLSLLSLDIDLTLLPQSLKEIKKKVNNGTYPNTDAFAADIHQMLNNAMTYVRPPLSPPLVHEPPD